MISYREALSCASAESRRLSLDGHDFVVGEDNERERVAVVRVDLAGQSPTVRACGQHALKYWWKDF